MTRPLPKEYMDWPTFSPVYSEQHTCTLAKHLRMLGFTSIVLDRATITAENEHYTWRRRRGRQLGRSS